MTLLSPVLLVLKVSMTLIDLHNLQIKSKKGRLLSCSKANRIHGFHYKSDGLNLTSLKERLISPHILWTTSRWSIVYLWKHCKCAMWWKCNCSWSPEANKWITDHTNKTWKVTCLQESGGSRPWAKVRGGGGGGAQADLDLQVLALPAIFPSVSSSFLTQNKGGGGVGGWPSGPPQIRHCKQHYWFHNDNPKKVLHCRCSQISYRHKSVVNYLK